MKVGVIGLGTMGMGAALNLVKHGHAVHGCELREAARTELKAAGGQAVARAADLPGDLEALIIFVVNAAQTDEVLFGDEGCAASLAPGTVLLCCTTVAPEAARTLGDRLDARASRCWTRPSPAEPARGGHDDGDGVGVGRRVCQGAAGARCHRQQSLAVRRRGRASAAR